MKGEEKQEKLAVYASVSDGVRYTFMLDRTTQRICISDDGKMIVVDAEVLARALKFFKIQIP